MYHQLQSMIQQVLKSPDKQKEKESSTSSSLLLLSTTKQRQQRNPQLIDMNGSFLDKEEQDFFDRDPNTNSIVVQKRIPIFPEDFKKRSDEWPLSWWGIIEPPASIVDMHRNTNTTSSSHNNNNKPYHHARTYGYHPPPTTSTAWHNHHHHHQHHHGDYYSK